MTGKELQQSVKLSGLKAQQVADGLGVSRQSLYDLYKKKGDIGEAYTEKALQMGLTIVNPAHSRKNTIPFTAEQLFKMWEDSESQRQAVTSALVALVDSHNKLIKEGLIAPVSSAKHRST